MEQLTESALPPDWITGFSDGEATFTYSRGRGGAQMALYYAIKLTGIERPVLERVQDFFGGIGTIYDVAARFPTKNSGATKTAVCFRVSRTEELMTVVGHFDQYPLRSNKQNVFEVWRLMVLLKRKYKRPDQDLMDALADKVTELCVKKQTWR